MQLFEQQSAFTWQLKAQHTPPRQELVQHSPGRLQAWPFARQPHRPPRQLTAPQHCRSLVHATPPGLQPQMPPEHEPRQQSLSAAQVPPWPAQHLPPEHTVLQHSAPAAQITFVVLHVQDLFRHCLLQQSAGARQLCW